MISRNRQRLPLKYISLRFLLVKFQGCSDHNKKSNTRAQSFEIILKLNILTSYLTIFETFENQIFILSGLKLYLNVVLTFYTYKISIV